MGPRSSFITYLLQKYPAAFLLTCVTVIRKKRVYNGYKNIPCDESGFGSQLVLCSVSFCSWFSFLIFDSSRF